ncbi:MAG: Glyoxalase/bleomycin resistance protein/dioxygenase [Conexibacter sp.]|nr:Glyoxalase/bleomycin resistance protein/dioxygenase [Conexibacter sp.]
MPSRRIVIDHLSIGVSDLRASRRFYLAALAPLGFAELGEWSEDARDVAFGPDDLDDFAISTKYPVGGGGHIAFAADSREQVDAFHDAAIAAGATDNGGPGVRTEYSPGYYGAFVLDPDGYNVEAVYHEPLRRS